MGRAEQGGCCGRGSTWCNCQGPSAAILYSLEQQREMDIKVDYNEGYAGDVQSSDDDGWATDYAHTFPGLL